MRKMQLYVTLSVLSLVLTACVLAGCSPTPPTPYQQLQVQDDSESKGYDVYMYVAVEKGLPEGDVTKLLEWFRDVKYPEANKIMIFVWDNPQGALMSASGDLIATLEVDRANGIDNITTNVSRV